MPRTLIIVHRDASPELHAHLVSIFHSSGDVSVIRDRRVGERRCDDLPVSTERRRGERRTIDARPNRATGWAIVRLPQ
ncbi:MAG TPA: hypothetical protein VNN07_07440 [Candidatus Tectomicrobia bacterium]|nr:hypothetical protein [Candidatus Tectomicrobia bacterium]